MTASNALADIIERLKRREQTMGVHEARPPALRSVPEPGHLVRIVEALLFAAAEPLSAKDLAAALPEGSDVSAVLGELQRAYAPRGVNLVQVAGKWAFRTAEDLSHLMRRETVEARRLSRAALETLAIIAYHQPVTRAEVEDIRGVAMSRGTLDQLLEIGWVRMRGRRRSPGRPVTYGTTDSFLVHFGLDAITDLPGLQELKGAGLLDANLPPDFDIPVPAPLSELAADEDPLEDEEAEPALEKDEVEAAAEDAPEEPPSI
jgi:segregation and condensation protein B